MLRGKNIIRKYSWKFKRNARQNPDVILVPKDKIPRPQGLHQTVRRSGGRCTCRLEANI